MTTLSLFLGEAGSIAGLTASKRALAALRGRLHAAKYRRSDAPALICDTYVVAAGEHVVVLVTHTRGLKDGAVRATVADAFAEAARTGCGEGLCGVPLVEAEGLVVSEIEFEERCGEACLLFVATMADRVVVDMLRALAKGRRGLSATVSRPCADEPNCFSTAMAIRASGEFVPAATMLRTFAQPGNPAPIPTGRAAFAPIASVACTAFCIHQGRLSEAVDCFSHPYWDKVREHVMEASLSRRTQTASGD